MAAPTTASRPLLRSRLAEAAPKPSPEALVAAEAFFTALRRNTPPLPGPMELIEQRIERMGKAAAAARAEQVAQAAAVPVTEGTADDPVMI